VQASVTETVTPDELLDVGRFDAAARASLRREFEQAEPFPHLVLHDMLRVDPEILSSFPDTEWRGWLRFDDEYQPGKLFATDLAIVPEPFRRILVELNSRSFLVFLEEVTSINALIPDPYLEGGGLHSSGPGGVLRPHTDFHIYPRLRLYRYLNALLYLNPGWKREFGGLLELYDDTSDRKVTEVVPSFGTLVIYRLTTGRSTASLSPCTKVTGGTPSRPTTTRARKQRTSVTTTPPTGERTAPPKSWVASVSRPAAASSACRVASRSRPIWSTRISGCAGCGPALARGGAQRRARRDPNRSPRGGAGSVRDL